MTIAAHHAGTSGMRIAYVTARGILGLIFVVTGFNTFLHFLPMSPPAGLAGDFMKALNVSHYYFVVASLQIVGGALCLLGRYVPLGLLLVGPVVVNILLYHIFLEHTGWPLGAVAGVLSLFLVWSHRGSFAVAIEAGPN